MIMSGIGQEGIFIGEVCRKADCTPRTVRHYEVEGLITPMSLTSGGRKLYGNETISMIRSVQVLKRLGYSLKDIRKIIVITKSSNTAHRRLSKKLRNVFSEALTNIDAEMMLLTASRKNIANLLEKTEKCQSCAVPDCKDCGKLKSLRNLGLMA